MDFIDFDKSEAVANGNCRHLFLHNNKCIKVSLKETLKQRREIQKKKNFIKYLFKPFLRSYDENYKDLKFYKINKNKEDIYKYIPRFYGICKTNLGMGLIVEYLTDKSGNKLPTLQEYIKQNGVSNKLLLAINELWTILLKNNIQIRAPHSNNFLVKEVENNLLRIYMIDGFGSPNLIPLYDFVPFFGRRKIRNKFGVFVKSLIQEFPKWKNELNVLIV